MKVFLAMPYSQLCDKVKYEVMAEYRGFFEKLTSNLRKNDIEYFLAHEREKWGKTYSSAEESTKIDFDTIKSVDLVCVIPGVPHSGGVHVEMGWASACGKQMKIFLKKDYPYSPMVTGIHCLTDAEYYYYEEDYSDELVSLITKCILEFKEELTCTE